jgi:membrane-bound serine protease (ClpP class)
VGIAQTALAPAGKVFVHGEIWDAVALTEVPAGEKVVVERVDGFRLSVKPVSSGSATRAEKALV